MSNVTYHTRNYLMALSQKRAALEQPTGPFQPTFASSHPRILGSMGGAVGGAGIGALGGALGGAAAGALASDYDEFGRKKKKTRGQRALGGAGIGAMYGAGGGALAGGTYGAMKGPKAIEWLARHGGHPTNPRFTELLSTLKFMALNRGRTPLQFDQAADEYFDEEIAGMPMAPPPPPPKPWYTRAWEGYQNWGGDF